MGEFDERQFRVALCWFSVDDLCRGLGADRRTISKWRNGTSKPLHYNRDELMKKLWKMREERTDGLR